MENMPYFGLTVAIRQCELRKPEAEAIRICTFKAPTHKVMDGLVAFQYYYGKENKGKLEQSGWRPHQKTFEFDSEMPWDGKKPQISTIAQIFLAVL